MLALGIATASACKCDPTVPLGHPEMPPCCADLEAQKEAAKDLNVADKNTPGGACSSLTSCDSCTTLSFCHWSQGTSACIDEANVPAGTDFVAHCEDVGLSFTMAALTNEASNGYDHIHEEDKDTYNVSPVVAHDDSAWPAQYDGYLPPSGCIYIKSMTKEEIAKKYPSGLPGCGDYVNEGYTAEKGHMTTDIVSDPRLPVETHVPHYPLGANINLPDGMVMGGDFNAPQPESPWVKPAFNDNGCLGGPCDDSTQHACVGLSCSHIMEDGNTISDDREGSMYKREKHEEEDKEEKEEDNKDEEKEDNKDEEKEEKEEK